MVGIGNAGIKDAVGGVVSGIFWDIVVSVLSGFLGVVVKSVFGGVGLKSIMVWRARELRGVENWCVPDFCVVVEKESNLSQKCPVGGNDVVKFFVIVEKEPNVSKKCPVGRHK